MGCGWVPGRPGTRAPGHPAARAPALSDRGLQTIVCGLPHSTVQFVWTCFSTVCKPELQFASLESQCVDLLQQIKHTSAIVS